MSASKLIDRATEQPTKMIDLDDDCLERIFHHLDLISLFNVAVANEWMRPAARSVYKRPFGHKPSFIADYTRSSDAEPYECDNTIHVHGLKACLQYLRCLSSSISDLYIWYGNWNKVKCRHIDQYINKYCANSLTVIGFLDKPIISTHHFEKPFDNVQEVYISDVNLYNQLASFLPCFPNLSSLKLHYHSNWYSFQ